MYEAVHPVASILTVYALRLVPFDVGVQNALCVRVHVDHGRLNIRCVDSWKNSIASRILCECSSQVIPGHRVLRSSTRVVVLVVVVVLVLVVVRMQ